MKLIKKYENGGSPQDWRTALAGFMQSSGYGMIAQGVDGMLQRFPTPNADLNSNNQMAANARGTISNTLLSSGNPYAMAAGVAITALDKTGGFSDVSKGLGGGTDALNAISSFVPGMGYLLNKKKTDDYKMSADMQVMQNSYAGTTQNAHNAEANAGAKLLFGRSKANMMIEDAKLKDNTIQGIKQNSDADYLQMASMTQNKAMQNAYGLRGGYVQNYARYGQLGMKINKIKQLSLQIKFKEPKEINKEEVYVMKDGGQFFQNLVFKPTTKEQDDLFFSTLFTEEEIQKFQNGGKVKKEKNDKTYKEFLSTLPENLQQGNDGEDGYRMRYLFDNSPNVWNFQDALNEKLFELNPEDNSYHGFSIFPLTGEFLKSSTHPTVKYELDWYNGDSDEAKKFREEYDLITEEDGKLLKYYKYKRKVESHKEGGQMNVIPEGSLHARLHHMENAENFTKKGIPVIDNSGEQQAEIERSEIIFNKETTEKLEELYKKFNSDEYTNKEKENFAIEAGKLLSVQIMENTDDRVGLLNNEQ